MRTLKKTVRWSLMGATGMLLVACAGSQEIAHNPGNAFNDVLSKGYTELAAAEQAEADYSDADNFTKKATMASSGAAVSPDNFRDREGLSNAHKVDAISMRAKLMGYLDGKNTRNLYQAASAKAQVAYDCWIQEAEEDRQADHIQACKDEFDTQIARLAELTKPAPVVLNTTTKAKEVDMPGPISVYFGFDSAELDDSANRTLDGVAKLAKKINPASIKVEGHTDTAGASSYNTGLSVRRAMAVKAALEARGVDSLLRMSSKGEAKPKVETVDGVRERLNRRVVITLSN